MQHPSKFWDETYVFQKSAKTKMTALARSIDSKGGWTDSIEKYIKTKGLGLESSFIIPS